MSDFLLQKSPGRGGRYHEAPGIWYSEEMRRWAVTSPDLIREAMYNDALAVPNYDVSPMVRKLNVDLSITDEVRKCLPLAWEGERHRELREIFARYIAARTRPALDAASLELEAAGQRLAAEGAGTAFCLYRTFIRPAVRKAVSCLAEIDVPDDIDVELIPQMFDDTISMSRRKRIEAVLAQILAGSGDNLAQEEKHFRIAVLAVSANTLLGSVGLTIAERLQSSPGCAMDGIDWGRDLIRTSLTLVEKRALRDTVLGGVAIRAGDRLRLFVEAGGVSPETGFDYNDLFFAVGAHKCIGMSFSRQVWSRFASFLSTLPRSMRLIEVRERGMDHVFNFPETIMVTFDD